MLLPTFRGELCTIVHWCLHGAVICRLRQPVSSTCSHVSLHRLLGCSRACSGILHTTTCRVEFGTLLMLPDNLGAFHCTLQHRGSRRHASTLSVAPGFGYTLKPGRQSPVGCCFASLTAPKCEVLTLAPSGRAGARLAIADEERHSDDELFCRSSCARTPAYCGTFTGLRLLYWLYMSLLRPFIFR